MTLAHSLALLAVATSAGILAQPLKTTRTPIFDAVIAQSVKWSNARDEVRINREFHYAEHTIANGILNWRFSPRPKIGFNDLFLYRQIQQPFSRIIVTLDNPGHEFKVCAKMSDAVGAEWVADAKPLATSKDTVTVVFPWQEWKHASWSSVKSGDMLFPTAYFCLIAFGIKENQAYEVNVRSIEIELTSTTLESVNGFTFPDRLRADSKVDVKPFSAITSTPLTNVSATLTLLRGSTSCGKLNLQVAPVPERPAGLQFSANSPLELSWLLRSGDYHLDLLLTGTAPDGTPNVTIQHTLQSVRIDQVNDNSKPLPASVRNHNGVPTLFVGDTPHSGMSAAAYGPSVEKFASFTMADVDLFTFCATPTEGYPGLASITWKAPDVYDYTQLETRTALVLNANPKAKIFPRLYLHAPAWWSEKHPDDVVIAEKPDGTRYVFQHRGIRPAPSWASTQWRKDTAEGLRRLIAFIQSSPYADNYVGYHLASGITEEWMMWGSNENEWVDYSPVNQQAFRQWLRRKYKTDNALRQAWHNDTVTLDTAEVPSYKQRAAAGHGSFRDLATEMPVVDFYTYNSWLVADTIEYFAKVVKDATNRTKTVGVFYGYLLQLGGGHRIHNSGHLALHQVLSCPDIDFVCSPTSYSFRQLGGLGTTHFMSLVDSVKLHGKLWFDENDVRTSISPGKLGTWGKPADIAGDKLQQDKELACVLTNGVAQWWFDVGSNRYDAPDLRAVVKNLARVGCEVLPLDRSSNLQASLIVDPFSIPYMKVNDRLGSELLVSRLPALHRAGFPVGHFLSDDLPALKNHRLLILSTAFAPSDSFRANLDALKNDGRVIVFLHGSGLYSNQQFAPENMHTFTGIRVRLDEKPIQGNGVFTDAADFCQGLANTSFGASSYASPTALIPDDPEAIVIARFPDGRPAIAARRYPNWTAVYCAQPQLPSAFLRNLGRLSGVHSYIDSEDVVYANSSMLSVVATQPGQRLIRLPQPAKVSEMIDNRSLTDSPVSSFTFDFKEHQTAIFKLEH